MKYSIDLHTHTIVSGHAYTTLLENAKAALENGITLMGTSEHGPNMPGGPHIFYFGNIKTIPRKLFDVTVLRGCEANIIDYTGKVDIPDSIANRLDYMLASLHTICIAPGSVDQNTNALIGALKNRNVFIIGHSGNPEFPIDKERFVAAVKEKGKWIEINNGSFNSRGGSEDNCAEIAKLCIKYKVKVIIGSDSHFCYDIGKFESAINILKEVGMPDELIMNGQPDNVLRYLKSQGKLNDIKLD